MKRLAFFAILAAFGLGATPPAPMAVVSLPLRTNYVAVRAEWQDNGNVGEWSKEVQVTNLSTAVLAWDPVPGTRYTLGYSTNSGKYTTLVAAGTNTTFKLVTLKTNRVVTVTPLQSATVRGPWSAISNWPSINFTNPSADKLFKYQITETNL